jgi:hypothetical protein
LFVGPLFFSDSQKEKGTNGVFIAAPYKALFLSFYEGFAPVAFLQG